MENLPNLPNALSPCVRLFVEWSLAEAFDSRAIELVLQNENRTEIFENE